MAGVDGQRWDAWDSLDLDDWAGSGPPEASAAQRAAAAGLTRTLPEPVLDGPAPVRRRRTGRRVLVVLLATGLVLGSWAAGRPGDPLGAPAAAPVGTGGYAFLEEHADGRPVTFDPCQEIHYVVRPDGAPPSGAAMVEQALAELHRATGLVFVDDGLTDEAPAQDRSRPHQWSVRDTRPPVLIAWATEEEWPSLAGTVVGEAGPVSESVAGSVPRYTTGQVVLDAEDLDHPPGDRDGERAVRAVLMHELGHLVGLGHVDDPSQLMYARSGPEVTGFGTGDLRGLHELGSGDCV